MYGSKRFSQQNSKELTPIADSSSNSKGFGAVKKTLKMAPSGYDIYKLQMEQMMNDASTGDLNQSSTKKITSPSYRNFDISQSLDERTGHQLS